MRFVRRLIARGRLRKARRTLAKNPSPGNYAVLAQEYAQMGMLREVRQVAEEGLAVFPGNSQLSGLYDRARRLEREARLVELKKALADAPRPALWAEMCEILLDSGLLSRAEETARDWYEHSKDNDARLMLARVRYERFLADRGREQGRRAFDMVDEALAEDVEDARAWRLKMQFSEQVGAWAEARQCASRLLQLAPGDPVLEARFRTFDSMAEGAPSVPMALLEVERTGRLPEEAKNTEASTSTAKTVRPLLRDLATQSDVQAALYVRGSTVLVQGPRGATAERMARAVKKILTDSRTSGRRLGLGQIHEIELEGDFGLLTIAPGEMDAGALWTSGPLTGPQESALLGLAGMNMAARGVQA